MANEFVLTPAAWLQPASLFTPTPKAAQRVLEFSARRSITITRARLISTPRAAFRTCAMRGHRPAPRLRSQKYFRTINVQWIGKWGLFSLCASASPSALSRRPSHRPRIDFQMQRSLSSQIFALEQLRLGAAL